MPPRRGKCLVADKQRAICSEHRHAGRNSHRPEHARSRASARAARGRCRTRYAPRWWHWAQYFMSVLGQDPSNGCCGSRCTSAGFASCFSLGRARVRVHNVVPLSSVSAVESRRQRRDILGRVAVAGDSQVAALHRHHRRLRWPARRPWRCTSCTRGRKRVGHRYGSSTHVTPSASWATPCGTGGIGQARTPPPAVWQVDAVGLHRPVRRLPGQRRRSPPPRPARTGAAAVLLGPFAAGRGRDRQRSP